MRKRSALAVFATMALVIAGGGIASSAAAQDEVTAGTEDAPRDIVITMTDELRFDPPEISVMAGETVRFVLENPTAAAHDFTLGDLEAQELHNAQMAAGMTHDEEMAEGDADHDEEMAEGDADHDEEMAEGDADHDEEMAEGDADHDEEMAEGDADHDEEMAEGDADHDEEMAEGDAMEHGHDEGEGGLPTPVTIAPGETVAVVATFDKPGEVLIGCHQPGHWEAGMRGTITVSDL